MATVLAAAWLVASHAVAAHAMRTSNVELEFGRGIVAARVILPGDELELALGEKVALTRKLDTELERSVRVYLRAHLSATSPSGTPWSIVNRRVRLIAGEGHSDIEVLLTLRPPSGTSTEAFVLHDDAITHQVRSHVILVFLRSGDSSKPQSRVRLIGAMQFPVTSLSIRRPPTARASYPRPVN